ncbi:MAG TPA: sigma-70 family RNA polymerase sigma factor [Puia sp.]|nr:sigma-70 family RNA polymerase sigma factor [Puia sp.]
MNYSQMTDCQLFDLLQRDSRDAFASIYRRHIDGVYLCIYRLGGDRDLASDLAQEVFKSLWDYRMQLRDARHLRAYIYFVARGHFLSHLRSRRTAGYAKDELAFLAEAGEPSIELTIVTEEAFAELEAALRELSPQRRRVIQLRYFEGLDVRTIASQLKIAPQTVRNHLSQTIEFLREKKIFSSRS